MVTDVLRAEVEAILTRAGIANASRDADQIIEAAGGAAAGPDLPNRALALAEKRAAGAPLAYLIGRVPFMGLEMLVEPGALVPRSETELLCRTALRMIEQQSDSAEMRIIDMCCGSGNLACAIAAHKRHARVWGSDLTDGAVAVARMNVAHLGLGHRVIVTQGDLFESLAGFALEGTIDLIVCNPPYISTGRLAKDRAGLLSHEPREAFDGGPYGVSIVQRVIRDALPFLRVDGALLFEVGVGQGRQVSALFARTHQFDPVIQVEDNDGQTRVVAARKRVAIS